MAESSTPVDYYLVRKSATSRLPIQMRGTEICQQIGGREGEEGLYACEQRLVVTVIRILLNQDTDIFYVRRSATFIGISSIWVE